MSLNATKFFITVGLLAIFSILIINGVSARVDVLPTTSGTITCLDPSGCSNSTATLTAPSFDSNGQAIDNKPVAVAPVTGGVIGSLGTGGLIAVVIFILAIIAGVWVVKGKSPEGQ